MKKVEKIEEGEATSLVAPEQKEVLLQGDPAAQLEFAKKCSQALMQVLNLKPKKVMINGKQYIEYEDWQTLARFYGATVGTEWTKSIEREGKDKVWGYEAKATVIIKGELVSSAEAMCTRDERNWAMRDEFALRSMAQTRACAKALRNVFAWIVVMAGLQPTPAEEMDGVAQDAPKATPPASTSVHFNGYDEAQKKIWMAKMVECESVEDLKALWKNVPRKVQEDNEVEILKEDLKLKFGK